MLRFVLLLAFLPLLSADYSLECQKGHRVTSIRRSSSRRGLGSISIDCEKIASKETTSCVSQPSIPRCDGQLEGCTGSQWLGGLQVYQVENSTNAVVLDPVCCSSSQVRVVPSSCIHDRLNSVNQSFSHSIVSDLFYRGMQCWHQILQPDNVLIDLVWKIETCAFESEIVTPIDIDAECEECPCDCGPHECDNKEEPIKVTHKTRTTQCQCECSCLFKCI